LQKKKRKKKQRGREKSKRLGERPKINLITHILNMAKKKGQQGAPHGGKAPPMWKGQGGGHLGDS